MFARAHYPITGNREWSQVRRCDRGGATSVAGAKVNVGVVQQGKSLFLTHVSVEKRLMPPLSWTSSVKVGWYPSKSARLSPTVSFLKTVCKATIYWMSVPLNITGSIILGFSQMPSTIFNGVENFCNHVKRQMRKFNDDAEEHIGLYWKECKWRFNTHDPTHQ